MRLCWLIRQRPITNATWVGFKGERSWPFASSNVICKTTFPCVFELTNRVRTLFTSLGTSADCRELTYVPREQVRTGNAHLTALSFSGRRSSWGWGVQGKVARTPHQRRGSDGTVCPCPQGPLPLLSHRGFFEREGVCMSSIPDP